MTEIEKIIQSIRKTGYPLELKVGNTFSTRHWNTQYNRYYIDNDEQKGREIDVLAYKVVPINGNDLEIAIHVVVEVKQSIDKPWIIFTTGAKKKHEFIHGYSRPWYSYNFGLGDILKGDEIEIDSGFDDYTKIGRSYHEGFKDDSAQSRIFQALAGVVKATEHVLKSNKKAAEKVRKDGRGIFSFLEPIILLDGKLYEACLDEKGEIIVEEKSRSIVSFGYQSAMYKRFNYGVQILTFPELNKYILQKEHRRGQSPKWGQA